MQWNSFIIDSLFLIAVSTAFYSGFRRGLARQIIWLASFLLGYIAANAFAYDLARLSEFVLVNERVSIAAAFVAIFLIVILLCYIVGRAITKILNLSILGLANSVLGGLLSGLITLILLAVVTHLTMYFAPDLGNRVKETITVSNMIKAQEKIVDLRVVEKLHNEIKEFSH